MQIDYTPPLFEFKPVEHKKVVAGFDCQPFGTGQNGRLKDDFGGKFVRVRGPDKIMCHLMFGVLALTVEQSMRLLM
jgi:hypothetical protein